MRDPKFTTLICYLPTNELGRDFIVGDIHGCYEELMWLLKKVKFDKKADRLISVGDLADRGPFSEKCMQLIKKPWFYAVRGNHEQLMIDWYHCRMGNDNSEQGLWEINGGAWGVQCHEAGKLKSLVKLAEELPVAIVVGRGTRDRYNVLHAEWLGNDAELDTLKQPQPFTQWTNFSNAERNEEYEQQNKIIRMLWGRSLYNFASNGHTFEGRGLSTTFVGHSIVPEVSHHAQHVFLDTGGFTAYPGYWNPSDGIQGRLTMLEYKTQEIFEKTMKQYQGFKKK